MNKINLTLLTVEEIFGSDKKKPLEIFEKYGTKAAITDFSVALGGYINDNFFTDDGKSLANRTGWWWTKSPINNDARAVDWIGSKGWIVLMNVVVVVVQLYRSHQSLKSPRT